MISGLYDAPVPNIHSNAGGNTVKYPMYVTWFYLLNTKKYPITSTLIHTMVPSDEKRVTQPKIAQCLKRLAQCGYFTRKQQGRGYLYEPTGLFIREQRQYQETQQ